MSGIDEQLASFSDGIKSHSTKSSNVILSLPGDAKSDTEEQKLMKEQIYKTPNYKNKKRSTLKYMTKHSTSNIQQHEAKMEQKYGVKLSVRKDVVNKTLFRALKRYYTEAFLNKFTLCKKEATSSYLTKINQFCIETFSTHLERMTTWGITFEEVEKFISMIVSPNHIKNSLKDDADLIMYKDYYSCLYQYSHKKLANMLLSPVCGYLFTDFINSDNFTPFINSCPTMSQHPDAYLKTGTNFISIIMGMDKK